MPFKNIHLSNQYIVSISVLIGLTIVAALLAPAEATLGNIAKLVYAHAAQAWIGIFGFSVAAVFSVAFLVTRNKKHLYWAESFEKTSLAWWFIHVSSSLITMQKAWGGIYWQEPRFRTALLFLLIGSALFFAALLVNNEKATALLYIVNIGVLLWLLIATGRVMHPTNPIYGAEHATAIKLYTSALVIIFLLLIVQLARLWHTIDSKRRLKGSA